MPSWLVDVVDGHMDGYVGPDPVLFRTAGVGLGWFIAADDNPGHLEVTDAHQYLSIDVLRSAAESLTDAGATVDADAYVWGDGDADGVFRVRVHRLFGVFPEATSAVTLAELRDELGTVFHVSIVPSRVGVTVQVAPRLVHPGKAA